MMPTKQIVVGIPKETRPGETMVALIPSHVSLLAKVGLRVAVESGAGEGAGFPDEAYRAKGAVIESDRAGLFDSAEILLQVRTLGANPQKGRDDLSLLRAGHVLIGLADPLGQPLAVMDLAKRGVTMFAMELMPRISRAQSMDVLSSLATIVGYKSVLLAAATLPKVFPMLMTAAGTITPARVLVIGAGVAGLQAIATARRVGAAVSAYDVRPAAKDEIKSVGAKVIEAPLVTGDVEERSGYAKTLDEARARRQRDLLAPVVAASDVVIATAAVPGRPAPLLITREMVARMANGSVIVDVAADRGGNCAVTRPDEVVRHHGVTVLGPTNLPGTVPAHASQMYGRNLANFLAHLCRDGVVRPNGEDEITRGTMVLRNGKVMHPQVQALLIGGESP